MHNYSTNTPERTNFPLAFSVFSIIIVYLIHYLLSYLNLELKWWMEAPGVLAVYGLIYRLYDKVVWKTTLVKKLGISKIPDLNGTWKGHIKSSFDEFKSERDCTIIISQTWRELLVCYSSGDSRSNSLSGSIIIRPNSEDELIYEYLNEPKPNSADTLHMHRGTCRLFHNTENGSLIGYYYSGRGRLNHGELSLLKTDTINTPNN